MENKGTFLGRRMAQSEFAILFWEELLYKRKFKRIIDIGTYNGNFSWYLALYCEEKKAEFYTFDIASFQVPKKVRRHFKKLDVFENEKMIGDLIKQDGLTILFCDGGNKPKELKIFTPYLKRGDIIVVHDWKTEVFEKDIPIGLSPIFLETYEELTKAFIKIR